MNKSLLMSRVSLMLGFFAFFFLLVDKVEAKATNCTYEYLDGTISFSVNQNDELVLKSNVYQRCGDTNGDGVAETCIDHTVQGLTLTRLDVQVIMENVEAGKADRNSQLFLYRMETEIGWDKKQVDDVLDNGCNDTNCKVKIKLDKDGYCPKIYVAENVTGTISTVMPGSINCNGSKMFNWISDGPDDLYACNGAPTNGYDAIENRQCNEEQVKQAIDSSVNTEINALQSDYEKLSGSINTDTFDPSQAPDQNNIDQYCNQPVVAVKDYIDTIQNYTDDTDVGKTIDDILSEVKNQYANCRLPISDTEIKEDARNKLSAYLSTLSADISSLASRASSKASECIKMAENMTQDEKDDAIDKIEQDTEDSRDSALSSLNAFKEKISSITFGDQATISCEGLLGDKLLNKIDEIFGYVKIAAPIILILLGSIDFGQVVLMEGTDNKDALKKATSRFVKRAIVCIAIFFLPTILSYILHFIDGVGVDPLCGIK